MKRFSMILLSARPWSFILSVSTVTVGAMLALQVGAFHFWRYILVLFGMICFHAAMNLINDYFDVKHGVDRVEVATAQYRPHPLVEGSLTPRDILIAAAIFYVIGNGIGIAIAFVVGWPLIALLAGGFLISYFYSGDPINFKAHAMGELVMFVATGPLMLTGVYYSQTGSFAHLGTVLLVSIPTGLWWTLPLVANNMKDIETDRTTPGGTVAIKLGLKGSLVFYSAMAAVIYISTAVGIVLEAVPVWGVLVFITVPAMIRLVKEFYAAERIPADADPQTMKIEIPFTALLVAAYLLGYFIPASSFM